MANLITRLRRMVDDALITYVDKADGTGSGSVFWLQNHPVSPDSEIVTVNGTVQNDPADYSLNDADGRLSFVTAPPVGVNNVEVQYQASDFSDDEHADLLDLYRVDIIDELLEERPERVAGSITEWHDYYSQFENFEETDGGSAIFIVKDVTGSVIGSADYTPNYINGHINFPTDTEGSNRYLDARSYDLAHAAADIWKQKAALTSAYYRYRADGHQLDRQQWFEHCMEMNMTYLKQAKPMHVDLVRDDLK